MPSVGRWHVPQTNSCLWDSMQMQKKRQTTDATEQAKKNNVSFTYFNVTRLIEGRKIKSKYHLGCEPAPGLHYHHRAAECKCDPCDQSGCWSRLNGHVGTVSQYVSQQSQLGPLSLFAQPLLRSLGSLNTSNKPPSEWSNNSNLSCLHFQSNYSKKKLCWSIRLNEVGL